jgi:hypothetical protein
MKTLESSSELELLRQKVAALEARMAQLSPRLDRPANGNNFASPTDRRGMMKKIAGLAVGVVTAGLLRPGRTLASVQPVPDTTGSAILMGAFNQPSTSVATVLGNVGTTLASVVFVGANTATSGFTPPDSTSIGVAGHASNASASNGFEVIGVFGRALASDSTFGIGVHGEGTMTGVEGVGTIANTIGVAGQCDSGTFGIGVQGSSISGVGGAFSGGRAALSLSPGTSGDPNTTPPGGGLYGDIYLDNSKGGIWYNAGNITNPYLRLADNTTAGALTAFAPSSRFVNTITGSGNTYDGQHLNGGATATYQIGGVTVNGNKVQANARAVMGRIADPNPAGPGGNILVGPTNPPVGGVIAIIAGSPQNSFFISALDTSGKLFVENTSPSGSTDIIIDIAGYYL